MNIAVLSLCRDRLAFTQHCFETLRENAGCDFDHYVLDNGSTDGTADWLKGYFDDNACVYLRLLPNNVGISRGMNDLLDNLNSDYDVVVKFDNDCELIQPDTLIDVCELVVRGGCLLSPTIKGLRQPPRPTRTLRIGDEDILDIPQIGGIFLAAPAWVYDDFRYSTDNPFWGMDDVQVCAWWRDQGGTCGYVKRLEAWHYMGTDGQRENDPGYFARKDMEYAA